MMGSGVSSKSLVLFVAFLGALSFQGIQACKNPLAHLGRVLNPVLNFALPKRHRAFGLEFEFATKPGEQDRIYARDATSEAPRVLVYAGVIKRVPLVRLNYKERHRRPREIPERVSFYVYNPDTQDPSPDPQVTLTVVVEGSTLVFDTLWGYSPAHGIFLGREYFISVYEIPKEYSYAGGGHVTRLTRSRRAWKASDEELVLISVKEADHDGVMPVDVALSQMSTKILKVDSSEDENEAWLVQGEDGEWTTQDGFGRGTPGPRYINQVPKERYTWVTQVPTLYVPDPSSSVDVDDPDDVEVVFQRIQGLPRLAFRRGPIRFVGNLDYSDFSSVELSAAGATLTARPRPPGIIPLNGDGWEGSIFIERP